MRIGALSQDFFPSAKRKNANLNGSQSRNVHHKNLHGQNKKTRI